MRRASVAAIAAILVLMLIGIWGQEASVKKSLNGSSDMSIVLDDTAARGTLGSSYDAVQETASGNSAAEGSGIASSVSPNASEGAESSAGGSASSQEASSGSTLTAAAGTSESSASESTSSGMVLEQDYVIGVVIDASANVLSIQSSGGSLETFEMTEETDISRLVNGVTLGEGVMITYDDFTAKMIRPYAADAGKDVLKVAGKVLMAMNYRDVKDLADLCHYPVRVGKGKGTSIPDKSTFLSRFDSGEVYTSAMVENVMRVDLMRVTETQDGVVLSYDGKRPDIILEKVDGSWMITSINY